MKIVRQPFFSSLMIHVFFSYGKYLHVIKADGVNHPTAIQIDLSSKESVKRRYLTNIVLPFFFSFKLSNCPDFSLVRSVTVSTCPDNRRSIIFVCREICVIENCLWKVLQYVELVFFGWAQLFKITFHIGRVEISS